MIELPRSQKEVEAFLAWLPTSLYANQGAGDELYLQGTLDALNWVLSDGVRPAPITLLYYPQRYQRPFGSGHVRMEQEEAHSAMAGHRFRDQTGELFHIRYSTGVENALGWVRGFAAYALPEDWPWPRTAE